MENMCMCKSDNMVGSRQRSTVTLTQTVTTSLWVACVVNFVRGDTKNKLAQRMFN